MRTVTVIVGDLVFRWRGGSFIGVWQIQRSDERVPDQLIGLPASLRKSTATRADIGRFVRAWFER